MPKLRIGNLVAEKPIIQGGMGVGISLSRLAAAVAEQGGIGVISSVGLGLVKSGFKGGYKKSNQDALRAEIRQAKKMTNGILGLNIMVAASDFDEIVEIALDEEIDIIFLGAGLPLKLPKKLNINYLKKMKTKVGVIVSSARATNIIFKIWDKKFNYLPDVVVIEGPKAGGHLGFKLDQIENPEFSLENILPAVRNIVEIYEMKCNKKIPLIAAGGIYTGADILKFLHLGANGIQMGTRFVTTHECDADYEFKKAYLDCTKKDIGIINSPVGLPGRAIINDFLKDVFAGVKKPYTCPWKCLKTCDYKNSPYCIALALTNAQKGILKNGFAFAGANAYLTDKIVSVQELFNSLKDEFNKAVSEIKVPLPLLA
ncbi:MAG: nitronate monooxygenase [Candidatus Cloacimonadota bacterium]|nr:nitronate monooxygenase [Candidatus Cloacimonadota bacterium]